MGWPETPFGQLFSSSSHKRMAPPRAPGGVRTEGQEGKAMPSKFGAKSRANAQSNHAWSWVGVSCRSGMRGSLGEQKKTRVGQLTVARWWRWTERHRLITWSISHVALDCLSTRTNPPGYWIEVADQTDQDSVAIQSRSGSLVESLEAVGIGFLRDTGTSTEHCQDIGRSNFV